MKREGGLGEPLIYALIGGCLGGVVSLLFSLGLQSVGFFADRHDTFAAMTGMGVGSAAFIFLVPVFIIIGLFIGSAIVHVCLMIVGGANQSFETTFRVIAFSQGSTGPLQMIPICGGLIAGVWALVCNCIGLARAHETDTGRAVLAVFLPLIVCCGGGLLIALMFGGIGRLECVTPLTSSKMRLRVQCLDARRNRLRVNLAKRLACVAGPGGSVANSWFAMAALHVSRDHWFAMRHVRYDAVWDSIFSRSLSGCIEMESTRVHSTLQPDSV